jgi:hypothetical protein
MPYNAYPKAQAQALDNQFMAIKTRVTANKNPLKTAALKKELDNAGKALKVKLDADIKGVRANAIEHWQKVDQWLGQCVAALKRSKDAYQAFLANGDRADAETATGAAETIRQIHEEAHADSNDFGQSWFELRGFNPSADEKYKANYKNEVGKLMAESKNYVVKVTRMATMAQEAAALKSLAIAKREGAGRVIVEKQGAAQDLLESMEAIQEKMFGNFNDPNAAAGNMETIKTNAANPKIPKTAPLKTFEQIFTNLTNLVKTYTQGITAMDKVYQTASAQFEGDDLNDPDIKAHLGRAKKLHTEARYKVQVLEAGYKVALKDMEKLRGHYKKK